MPNVKFRPSPLDTIPFSPAILRKVDRRVEDFPRHTSIIGHPSNFDPCSVAQRSPMDICMADVQAKDTWKAVLGDLQVQVTRPTYDTWLKDTDGISISTDLLTVGVATSFASEWLERRMYQLIQRTVQRVTGRPLEVQFQVKRATFNGGEDELPNPAYQQQSGTLRSITRRINLMVSTLSGPLS